MKYLVVIEETKTGFSAYSPDLDGCVATGSSKDEVKVTMQEAIEFHIDGLKEEGYEIPLPHCSSTYLQVTV